MDEDAEEGAEAEESVVECRYRMTGVTNTKFEVRVECDPAQADQEMVGGQWTMVGAVDLTGNLGPGSIPRQEINFLGKFLARQGYRPAYKSCLS